MSESIIIGPNGDDDYGFNKKQTDYLDMPVQQLHPKGKLPTKAYDKDAGWDLYCIADEDFGLDDNGEKYFLLRPHARHKFKTGIAVKAPDQHCLLFEDRSGMGNKGITKFAGVIDEPYTGELQVILYNSDKEHCVKIKEGDKIVQFLVLPVPKCKPRWVESLDKTDRAENGFGSTGR